MLSLVEARECAKCGSSSLEAKKAVVRGSHGVFNELTLTAYVCKNCHYVEFYEE